MKLKLHYLSPNDLIKNQWNPNSLTDENAEKLSNSLKRLGNFKPILVRDVDGTLEIIGGQHRWEAAKRAGHERIPVINLGTIDDNKAKEISLADNERYGEDDSFLFSEMLDGLETVDELHTFLPFGEDELENLKKSIDLDLDDLELDEDGDETLEPSTSIPKTHQTMKFKVPIEDAEMVSDVINKIITSHDLSDDDSQTIAGDALVVLCGDYK